MYNILVCRAYNRINGGGQYVSTPQPPLDDRIKHLTNYYTEIEL